MRRRRTGGWAVAGLLLLGLLPPTAPADAADAAAPRALFFGDSLFAGTGTSPKRPVQVLTASGQLHWRPTIDAFGGTGFTTGGHIGRPYLQRLSASRTLQDHFDVIVLEGGTNDADHGSVTRLRQSATDVVAYVQRRQPWARVVVLGAFTPEGLPTPRHVEVDRVLREVSLASGVEYVSQLRYGSTAGPGFYSPDRWHPNEAGYGVMGRDLARALSRTCCPAAHP